MKVCVVGLGYIGLPLALLLAKNGNQVLGFDVDSHKISLLHKNILPLKEHGLEELYQTVVKKKSFKADTSIQPADVFIVAVPTPQKNHASDLSYVMKSLEYIKTVYKAGDLIILESTVGPSDCEAKIVPTFKSWPAPVRFAHCPERAVPGNTLHEMTSNDRVIGGIAPEDAVLAKKVYQSFVKGAISLTTPNQAATIKTMENTYRAVNIALANEFAKIAKELSLDVWEAIELANHHPRVFIHQPSVGVGGHCIPVDPWFFVGESNEAKLIETALLINIQMPNYVAKDLKKVLKLHSLLRPTIGVLGITYKKNVDDVRETPVLPLIKSLTKFGQVIVSDPYLKEYQDFKIENLKALLDQSSVVIVATNHDKYKSISFKDYPNIKVIYDCHNLFTSKNLKGSKAAYYSLGRG